MAKACLLHYNFGAFVISFATTTTIIKFIISIILEFMSPATPSKHKSPHIDLTPTTSKTSPTPPLPILSSINPTILKSPNSPSNTGNPLQSHLHKSLSLSNGGFRSRLHQEPSATMVMMSSNLGGRKMERTKFTSKQKVKMYDFAERLGWKMVRANEDKIVENFCSEIGIRRNVFKVGCTTISTVRTNSTSAAKAKAVA